MKENMSLKTIGSALIAATFLFLAFGSGDKKSSSASSSSSNSTVSHNCSTCGKKYEGEGYGIRTDGISSLEIVQTNLCTMCNDCAKKDYKETIEARGHRGYQGN